MKDFTQYLCCTKLRSIFCTLNWLCKLEKMNHFKEKLKRMMTEEEPPLNNDSADSSLSKSKSRKLSNTEPTSYREPLSYREPISLSSLDSPISISPTESPVTSVTSVMFTDGLGSLGDIIHQCSTTQLDSFNTCDLPDNWQQPSPTKPSSSNNNIDDIDSQNDNTNLCCVLLNKPDQRTVVDSKDNQVVSYHLDAVRTRNINTKLLSDSVVSSDTQDKSNTKVDKTAELDSKAVEISHKHDQLFEVNTDLAEYTKCKKNPDHVAFFSPQKMQVKDLPYEIQHEDSLTFFTCAANLVVQISVNHTSAARGAHDMYSSYIGTSLKRNGSGFIASVDDTIMALRCKREDCVEGFHLEDQSEDSTSVMSLSRSISSTSSSSLSSNSSVGASKHNIYGGVCIRTNKHVIFDKSEADNAHVKFFFDTPDEKFVIKGHVTSIVGVNNSQDHITLHVMSHEKKLFDTVGICLRNVKSSYNQMVLSTHKFQTRERSSNNKSWVAVISHPHGKSKSITFGHVVKEEYEVTRVIKYYDAATCPGSSGGLVMTPNLLKLQWPGAVHSAYDHDTGLNVTMDSRFCDLENLNMGQFDEKTLNRKDSIDSLLI